MTEGEMYFILHAPRQSGKTTVLDFLTDKINDSGTMYALSCSMASLRTVKDEYHALARIVSQLNDAMRSSGVRAISRKAFQYDSLSGMDAPNLMVKTLLNRLCLDLDKDLAVFFDEADLLAGPGLLTFLAEIRDGYNSRHKPGNKFPRSLALVGMRDIRDYIASERPESAGGRLASPYNIVAERMTLANFTLEETGRLYRQHTEATRQVFEEAAIGRAWHWSEGQPWLVNALARQIIEVRLENDYSAPVTAPLVDEAAESLIKRRDTHIDSLIERLTEPRVMKVMDAVFAGTKSPVPVNGDDRRYCQDLGLVVKEADETLRPANKIYGEAMSRVITDQI
jgi:hypothetical protein